MDSDNCSEDRHTPQNRRTSVSKLRRNQRYCPSLTARPEQTDRATFGTGHGSRRDSTRSTGAQLSQIVGFDERGHLAGFVIVDRDVKLGPMFCGRVILPADVSEILGSRTERMQHDPGRFGASARDIHCSAVRPLQECFLDHIDGGRHINERFDIFLDEK